MNAQPTQKSIWIWLSIHIAILLIGGMYFGSRVFDYKKHYGEHGIEVSPATICVIAVSEFIVDYWYIVLALSTSLFLNDAFIINWLQKRNSFWRLIFWNFCVILVLIAFMGFFYLGLFDPILEGRVPPLGG